LVNIFFPVQRKGSWLTSNAYARATVIC